VVTCSCDLTPTTREDTLAITSDRPLIHPPEDSAAAFPTREERLLATKDDRLDPTEDSVGDDGLLLNPAGSRVDEVELREPMECVLGASLDEKDPPADPEVGWSMRGNEGGLRLRREGS
jgi:hypothetical protein